LKLLQGISKDVVKFNDNDVLLNTSTTSSSIKSNSNIRVDDVVKNDVNPHHRETISYFCFKHLNITGRKYHVQGAKDGTLVKKLLQTYSFDEIKEMMDVFFNAENWHDKEGEFVTGIAGYTIGVFYKTLGATMAKMKKTGKKKEDKYAGLSRV